MPPLVDPPELKYPIALIKSNVGLNSKTLLHFPPLTIKVPKICGFTFSPHDGEGSIKTTNSSLEGSLNHKLWACKNGKYDWFKLSELDIGDYIKQEGSDYISYGEITQKLKNGSFKAIVFTSYDGKVTGKAKIGISNMSFFVLVASRMSFSSAHQ